MVDLWMDGCVDVWVVKWMDEWMGVCVGGWMDGWVSSMWSIHTVVYDSP